MKINQIFTIPNSQHSLYYTIYTHLHEHAAGDKEVGGKGKGDSLSAACLSKSVVAFCCVLCWLATVDALGQPNVSPKEVFAVIDEEHLVIAHIASPTSVKNVLQNPKVCVGGGPEDFRDRKLGQGGFGQVFVGRRAQRFPQARTIHDHDESEHHDDGNCSSDRLPLIDENFDPVAI